MILKDQEISYKELLGNVNSFSKLFTIDNLSKVAIFSENRLEWVYTFYAVWMKKAIPVTIDYMSSLEDVEFILNDCNPEIIIYSNTTKEVAEKAIEKLN